MSLSVCKNMKNLKTKNKPNIFCAYGQIDIVV